MGNAFLFCPPHNKHISPPGFGGRGAVKMFSLLFFTPWGPERRTPRRNRRRVRPRRPPPPRLPPPSAPAGSPPWSDPAGHPGPACRSCSSSCRRPSSTSAGSWGRFEASSLGFDKEKKIFFKKKQSATFPAKLHTANSSWPKKTTSMINLNQGNPSIGRLTQFKSESWSLLQSSSSCSEAVNETLWSLR